MYLPPPSFTLRLPSVYDGSQLDCRLYLPRNYQRRNTLSNRCKLGAIVAHPYAPLGGCYDDPVVTSISAQLLQAGYVVGTFNFRGSGDSEGRTSWTAKPELADYVSFYGFMLFYLLNLEREADSPSCYVHGDPVSPTEIRLILAGYSYGSLIASHLPEVDAVVDLFKQAASGTGPYMISKIAGEVAAHSQRPHSQSPEQDTSRPSLTIGEIGLDSVSNWTVSYLLVSPLLPPLSSVLTLFSNLSLDIDVDKPIHRRQIPCPETAVQLTAHRTLAVYGSHDGFTSAKKLRVWCKSLSQMPHSQFQYRELDEADHFWREGNAARRMRQVLQNWLDEAP